MQELFVCCTAADRAAAEPVVAALQLLDAVEITVEVCEPGELPDACAAASDAAGVVLVLSGVSVPDQPTRAAWQAVLQRLEHAPNSLAAVALEPCPFPPMLRSRALISQPAEAPRAVLRWAVALDPVPDRFELAGFDEQYEYRDILWIPCAGRELVSVEEDLARAVDGRRVLIVLDGPPPSLRIPGVTRETILTRSPLPEPEPVALTAEAAACYPHFLHQDFFSALSGAPPGLPPLTRDGRILRAPHGSRPPLQVPPAVRRRHAELVAQLLKSGGDARVIRLELPAALDFAFATDWSVAADLVWRASRRFRDEYPRESASLLLRLRQSAVDNGIRAWIALCDKELEWLGVPPPGAPEGRKSDSRQLKLEW